MVTQQKPLFQAHIEQFIHVLTQIRTSRATPAMLENIPIEVYGGSRMLLKELATISVPEPRMLILKPWDKSIIKDIEKGLTKADLGYNPVVETDILRIQLPELTQETREKLVKKLKQIAEETRIKIRNTRDDIKKNIEKKFKEATITEDEKYTFIEDLNEMTKTFDAEIENLYKKKKTEIMTL